MVSNEEIKRRLDRKRKGLGEKIEDEKLINYKICPYCKFKNPENSIFCVKCGKKLEKNVTIKCNICGTINPHTAKFCIKCGNNLVTNKNSTSNQENTDTSTANAESKNDNKVNDSINEVVSEAEDIKKNIINQDPNSEEETKSPESPEPEEPKIKPSHNQGFPSSIPDPALINQKNNKKICASCGSKNLKNAKFCVVCGEKFNDTKIEKSNADPDSKIKDHTENPKSVEMDDPIEKIKRAKELMDIGAITPEEFESIKSKYLDMI